MRRIRRAAAAVAGLAFVAAFGIAVADFAARRAAFRTLRGVDPNCRVRFANRYLDDSRAEGLRTRFGGHPLPFDRFAIVEISGGAARGLPSPAIDDAAAERIAEAVVRAGGTDDLRLDETDLTDAGVARIAQTGAVGGLSLRNLFTEFAIGDGLGTRLARCPGLRRVELVRAPVTDRFTAGLAASRSLEEFASQGCPLTDASFAAMAGCPTLTHLTIQNSGGDGVTREGGWAFRLARPDVVYSGPDVPARVTAAELAAYRRTRDRLRAKRGSP